MTAVTRAALLALASAGLSSPAVCGGCGGNTELRPSGVGPYDGSGAHSGQAGSGQGPAAGHGGYAASGGGGASGTAGAGTGGTVEPCLSLGDPCTYCIAQQCPAAWCDCRDNPDCFDLFSCSSDCEGDEPCEQACKAEHEEGISDAILVSNCGGSVCADSCDWTSDPLSPCSECLLQDCEADMNACIAEPACTELWDCLASCPNYDLACQQACYDSHGEGVATLQTLLECSAAECEPSCW